MTNSFYDSTDATRVHVGEGTRHQYRELTSVEAMDMARAKELGDALIKLCQGLRERKPESGRDFSLAIEHTEDAVMRCVRGITG